MKKWSDKEILKAKKQINKLVLESAEHIREGLREYGPEERWLLYGRAVSALFTCHYRISIEVAANTDKAAIHKLKSKK